MDDKEDIIEIEGLSEEFADFKPNPLLDQVDFDEGIELILGEGNPTVEDYPIEIDAPQQPYKRGKSRMLDNILEKANEYALSGLIELAEKSVEEAKKYALTQDISVDEFASEIINASYMSAAFNSMQFAKHFAEKGMPDMVNTFIMEAKTYAGSAGRQLAEDDFRDIINASNTNGLNMSLSSLKKARLRKDKQEVHRLLKEINNYAGKVIPSLKEQQLKQIEKENLRQIEDEKKSIELKKRQENPPDLFGNSMIRAEDAKPRASLYRLSVADAIQRAREAAQRGHVKSVEYFVKEAKQISMETGEAVNDDLEGMLTNAYRRGKEVAIFQLKKSMLKADIAEADRCLFEARHYAEREGKPMPEDEAKAMTMFIIESAISRAEGYAGSKKYDDSARLLRKAKDYSIQKGVNISDKTRDLFRLLRKKGKI